MLSGGARESQDRISGLPISTNKVILCWGSTYVVVRSRSEKDGSASTDAFGKHIHFMNLPFEYLHPFVVQHFRHHAYKFCLITAVGVDLRAWRLEKHLKERAATVTCGTNDAVGDHLSDFTNSVWLHSSIKGYEEIEDSCGCIKCFQPNHL